ncbi:MAG: methionyl-tRNA formyltransferase [Candidatus Magasanikbacteria bacterium]|nr:methionyl-tRNA formyltransferase [Candidatus Magasanikbacteria bacterium]
MISAVFFGSHHFSTPILQQLIDSGIFDIQLVVTQPDRPVGRKQEIQMTGVKTLALKYNIPVEQPATLKDYTLPISADINIVCKYGLLVPESILNSAKHGSINTHASLLPKYRGASPIQSVLINGETETGATIMLMDKEMDHGPILLQDKLNILPDENCFELSERLAPLEADLLIKAIPDFIAGKITLQVQNHTEATFCKELTREDGQVDGTKTATEIYNLYRGLTPWPGIWTMWNEKRLKLLKIAPADVKIEAGKLTA